MYFFKVGFCLNKNWLQNLFLYQKKRKKDRKLKRVYLIDYLKSGSKRILKFPS